MLEARNLAKRFGEVQAVEDVSLRIGAGESVGLLGPNGAGKSTTVAMLCGLLSPDRGEVLVDGQRLRGGADPAKGKIGLVPQELALVEELSARANLEFFGALQGLGGRALRLAIDDCLDLVGLTGRATSCVRTFSGGMKRRLNLAAALLHDPEVLILDEPTVGVDPQSRNAIFDGLERLQSAGKAILYTTHYMEEAERLCGRLVIVDHGRVLADGRLDDLRARFAGGHRLIIQLEGVGSDGSCLGPIRSMPGVLGAESGDGRLLIDLAELSMTPRVLDRLGEQGVAYSGVSCERRSLESIFLDLTGRSLRDG